MSKPCWDALEHPFFFCMVNLNHSRLFFAGAPCFWHTDFLSPNHSRFSVFSRLSQSSRAVHSYGCFFFALRSLYSLLSSSALWLIFFWWFVWTQRSLSFSSLLFSCLLNPPDSFLNCTEKAIKHVPFSTSCGWIRRFDEFHNSF